MTLFERENVPSALELLDAEYELLSELGRGSMAVVYLARDRALDRTVAIKVIGARYREDPEVVARFAREARTVAELHHPNIIAVHAVQELGEHGLAIVMERLEGQTLRQRLRAHPVQPFHRAASVLRDIAGALAHAHSRGIVHRDVKPENVFLEEGTGRALLFDFGIARALDAEANLTMTGVAIGTPAYMSPEQIDNTGIDARSDLYSLGLVGWEMLAGERPWAGESLYSVLYRQKNDLLPSLEVRRPGTPELLRVAIEGALLKDREARWASADEMFDQLSGAVSPEAAARHEEMTESIRAERAARGVSEEAAGSTMMLARTEERLEPVARSAKSVVGAATLGAAGPLRADAADLSELPDESDPELSVSPVGRRGLRLAAGIGAALLVAVAVLLSLRSELVGEGASLSDASPPGVGGVAAGDLVRTEPVGGGVEPDTLRAAPPAGESAETTSATLGDAFAESRAPGTAGAGSPEGGVPLELARARDVTVAAPAAPPARAPPRTTRAPAEASPPAVTTAPPAAEAPVPVQSSDDEAAERDTGARGAPLPAATGSAAIAAGGTHSCVIVQGGQAYCWGANDRGQLGDASTERRGAPVRVAGSASFSAISAGISHTCAVTSGGDAYCWGENGDGQLGDGSRSGRAVPTRVASSQRFRLVRTGASHSCALTRAGEVYCWGSNADGQLGSARSSSATPVRVDFGETATALAAGWHHNCATGRSGAVYCWGRNGNGQLGDGTTSDRASPVTVAAGNARPFVAVAAGSAHSCAITAAGDAYCWGRNSFGQLGDGTAADRPSATKVSGAGGFSAVTAGSMHSCALTRGRQVFCWGQNTYGQLGDGGTGARSSSTPVRVQGSHPFVSIDASGAHTCATTLGGDSFCWGYNVEGQLGDGTRVNRGRPAYVERP